MNEKYRMLTKIVRNMKLSKAKNMNILNDNESEALRYITKHRGTTQSEIVEYLGVDKALVTRIVLKLVKDAYIIVENGTDKRKKHLFPTEKGLKLKLDNQLYEIDYYKALFEILDKNEEDAFFKTLEKIYLESKKRRKNYNERKQISL